LKKKVLDEVFKHVRYSKRKDLKFKKEDRKRLRDGLLKDWRFAKHYVDSAINSVLGLVKELYNRGKAKSKPEITKKTVYAKTVKDGKIRITINLEVDLTKFDYLPKDYDSIGGLILKKNELIITFKKVEVREAEDWASFDVNLTNVTAYINGRIVRFDLRELYHIHRVYEEKRRKIQKLGKTRPKVAKKLMKYSKREKNRAKNLMHKITNR